MNSRIPQLTVAAAAFAIWLAISGAIEAHAWAIFSSHQCSIDAVLCGVLPAILGFVVCVPLVAGEIQERTNRLAWTQSITKIRRLLSKVSVGALFSAVIVGAMAPLFWWWTDAAQCSNHIQPSNFDITGFVGVAYALFAFMLGVALGALIRRTDGHSQPAFRSSL